MKNKELLNICYRVLNRFITLDEFIDLLKKVKVSSKEEQEYFNNFLNDIKKIEKENPNREDDYTKAKKKQINNLLEKLKIAEEKSNMDFLTKPINNLDNMSKKEIDSHERWLAVTNYIINNTYFNECFNNLSKEELLEFITQYISAPVPPELTEEEFSELVDIGIKNDNREALWRLAFNYEKKDFDFMKIADYFIFKKDAYYLTELICIVGFHLDIDTILEKINDKELIKDLQENKDILSSHLSKKQLNKLMSKKDY